MTLSVEAPNPMHSPISAVTEVQYTCAVCAWVGSEIELDVLTFTEFNMVCCPMCNCNDVRVVNQDENNVSNK